MQKPTEEEQQREENQEEREGRPAGEPTTCPIKEQQQLEPQFG